MKQRVTFSLADTRFVAVNPEAIDAVIEVDPNVKDPITRIVLRSHDAFDVPAPFETVLDAIAKPGVLHDGS